MKKMELFGQRSGELYKIIADMILKIQSGEINSAGILMPEGLLTFIPKEVLHRESTQNKMYEFHKNIISQIDDMEAK